MARPAVFFVTDYNPPYIGGMEIHAEECVRQFEREGELRAVCLMSVGGAARAEPHFKEATGLLTPLTRLSEGSITDADELIRILNEQQAGDGSTLFFNSLYWIRILGDLRRAFPALKIFLRSGGNDVLQARIIGTGDTLEERQSYIAKQLAAYADGLIVNSEFTRQRFLKLGIDERLMHVVTGGVDVSRFTPADEEERREVRAMLGLPAEPVLILAACRLVPFKGMMETLSIFRGLETRAPFAYVIIGDGPERAALEHYADDNGMKGRVLFLGALPHHDLPRYFQAADIYSYFPRLERVQEEGGSYIHTETMGRSFCEAMAAGLPIVTSDVGGIREVVRSGIDGFLLDPADDMAKRAALARLIDNPRERANIGRAARQSAEERHSWETVVARYRLLFSS